PRSMSASGEKRWPPGSCPQVGQSPAGCGGGAGGACAASRIGATTAAARPSRKVFAIMRSPGGNDSRGGTGDQNGAGQAEQSALRNLPLAPSPQVEREGPRRRV